MISWLSRLLRGKRAPQPNPVGADAIAAADTAPTRESVAGSRRPLIDREGGLAGFEYRVLEPLAMRLQQRNDATAHAAHATAVLRSMRSSLASGRVALFALPLAIAARPAVIQRVPAGAMLALTDGPWSGAEARSAMEALHRRGALLGGHGRPLPGGQFVVLDASSNSEDALAHAAEKFRKADRELRIVATGLPNVDDLEHALRDGVDLAAGTTDRGAVAPSAGPLPPRLQRVCRLLSRVVRDEDLGRIAGDLRTDVELSYQLLRHANSPLRGLARPAESVEQAVMLVGRDGVYRWLTMLLLGSGENRPSSRALHEVALSRARLLEILAPRIGAPPSALFTTGLLSLLEVMARIPLAEAIEPLQLPPEASLALLEGRGPWRGALEMAQALERGDADAAEPLARDFGGLEEVQAHVDDAWTWAAAAAAETRR
ncbi:MAG TPA: HDOD domain-containing protein [Burkholderiaceae bacterium]|nr:HDOD domain-containing protein [Burkholderiaceae bacterium]